MDQEEMDALVSSDFDYENCIEAAKKKMGTTYRVICVISIDNWTNHHLKNPVVRVEGGEVEILPTDIGPRNKTTMVARKTAYTATGSYGTVSWLIQGKNRRIVFMWIAPFNFDFYDNWLAVGMTKRGVTDDATGNSWYKHMSEGTYSSSLRFSRMNYKNDVETVIYEEDGIEISGTMSTGHQAQVKITVRPVLIN